MNMISAFHFLRPAWLLCFIPLSILLWLMWRQRLASRSWQSVVDAKLLPHLLIGESKKKNPWGWSAVLVGGALAILALAGPAWRKLEVPVFRQESALVLLFDLSRSMDAEDVKPSRLERAKLKLTDILRRQKEGETALIVFAADAFVVSPLTTDANTIISQLQSFSTSLMPAQGSRPDLAVGKAEDLLKQAGSAHGGVLLITDGVDDEDRDALEKAVRHLHDAGHRLTVLGVGTAQGAPIPAPGGGFLKDGSGAIVLPRLDDAGLTEIARQGHGAYRRLGAGDADIDVLLPSVESAISRRHSAEVEGMQSDQWRDEGPWLLLPLLLLGAAAFRRGAWLVILLMMLQPMRPVQAMEWNSLWLNADQRGQRALAAQQPQQAAQLFHDPNWRAAAHYQAGNYQAAAAALKGIDTADALYNRGNALAHAGHLPEAVAAYDAALKKNPKLEDAAYNRDLLQKMMQQDKKKNASPSSAKPPPSKDGKPSKEGQKAASQTPDKPQADAQKNAGSENRNSSSGAAGNAQENPAKDHAKPEDGSQQNMQKKSEEQQQPKNEPANVQPDRAKAGAQEKKDASASNGNPRQDSLEKAQADRQWLQRIPDDPGGLWRNKFLYQYKRQAKRSERQPW